MESGIFSLPRRLDLWNTDQIFLTRTPNGTNAGVLNIGDGAFDGISTGKFSGNSAGTFLAINSSSTNLGFLIDVQTAGVSRFSIIQAGTIKFGGSIEARNTPSSTPNFSNVNLGPAPIDGVTSGFFTGNSTGTVLGINSASGSTVDFFMCQTFGVQKFRVDSAGNITGAGAVNDGVGTGAISRLDCYYNFT